MGWKMHLKEKELRNEINFWKAHGILNTSGLLQSKALPHVITLTLQETQRIHDSMNLPKIEFLLILTFFMNN